MSTSNIVCLCASHIVNIKRLVFLGAMLRSWEQQSSKCKLIIVLSAADERLYAGAMKFLGKYSPDDLRVIKHEGKQFEKYKYAVEQLRGEMTEDQWIIFTDDDDLWHPDRVKFFDSFTGTEFDFSIVRVQRIAENLNTSSAQLYLTTKHIDDALKTNQLEIIDTQPNYVNYLIKFKLLDEYLSSCPEHILSHKYSDMAFCSYMNRTQQLPEIAMWQAEDNWMYYYRLHEDIGQISLLPRKSFVVESLNTEVNALITILENASPIRDCRQNILELLHFMFDRLELYILTNGYDKTDERQILRDALGMYFTVAENDVSRQEVAELSKQIAQWVEPFIEDALKKRRDYLVSLG